MAKRSPILGYNHNIRYRGLVFHVQTEDSGVSNPHIFTHLFHGGVILSTRKLDYDAEAAEDVVKALMQAQHKAVLKDLKQGKFEGKIDSYLGDHPDLQPSSFADVAAREHTDVSAAFDAIAPGEAPAMPMTEAPTQPVPQVAQAGGGPAADPIKQTQPIGSRGAMADAAHIHSPGPESAPRVPGATAERAGTYARHRGSRDHAVDTTPVPARAPGRSSTAHRTRPQAPPKPPPRGGSESRPAARSVPRPKSQSGKVVVSRPAVIVGAPPKVVGSSPGATKSKPRTAREDSLFGRDLISEKSLDEVILAYLSEDSTEE